MTLGNTNVVADGRVDEIARSLSRWRAILLIVAIVVPGCLYAVFERQARRLDVLGARGEVTQAIVTGVKRQGGSTYVDYEYSVAGTTYTWNVDRRDAPDAAHGKTLPIVYSPEDPALSRPGTDRSKASAEAR